MGGPTSFDKAQYLVVFTSRLREDADGYNQASEQMLERVRAQPGFVDAVSVRGGDGFGITVSYWVSVESIRQWRADAEHTVIREQGRADWYQFYSIQIARIERNYDWQREQANE